MFVQMHAVNHNQRNPETTAEKNFKRDYKLYHVQTLIQILLTVLCMHMNCSLEKCWRNYSTQWENETEVLKQCIQACASPIYFKELPCKSTHKRKVHQCKPHYSQPLDRSFQTFTNTFQTAFSCPKPPDTKLSDKCSPPESWGYATPPLVPWATADVRLGSCIFPWPWCGSMPGE